MYPTTGNPKWKALQASKEQYLLLATFSISVALPTLVWFLHPVLYQVYNPGEYFWAHTILEVLSVFASLAVFMTAWHALEREHWSLHGWFLGTAFLIVGLLELAHFIAHGGVPGFVIKDPSIRADLYSVAARIVASGALFASTFFYNYKTRIRNAPWLWLAGGVAAALGIFLPLTYFPERVVHMLFSVESLVRPRAGVALAIIAFQAAAGSIYWFGFRRSDDDPVIIIFISAILVNIFSQLLTLIYARGYDTYDILAHIYWAGSILLIYRAMHSALIEKPYKELALAKDWLARSHEELEIIVQRRTRELSDVNTKLKETSTTDFLTQVYNRWFTRQRLEELLVDAIHYKFSLSIIMVDVDGFREINDNLGQDVGDHCLKSLADTIVKSIRDVDMVGRYGDDEFIVMFPETSRDRAISVAERLREKVERESSPRFTVSIGVAAFPGDGSNPEDILMSAEDALSEAKRGGKNRVIVGRRKFDL